MHALRVLLCGLFVALSVVAFGSGAAGVTSFAQPRGWIPIGWETGPYVRGSAYNWAQPGTAPTQISFAQPPASIPISWETGPYLTGSAYNWAQPGTAPVQIPFVQPPASIPIG